MNTDLTDTLDIALERLQATEPLAAILAGDPDRSAALRPLLEAAAALEAVRPVMMPPADALRADRADFLAHATGLQQQAVSPSPLARLKGWIAPRFPWPLTRSPSHRKEPRRMSALMIKAMLVFGLIFGSAGGTAALAESSLPGSPLYPLKLALEQTRLNLNTDPAEQAAFHLALAQVRIQEMVRMADAPDDATVTRLQFHLEQALRLAAQTPDETMRGLLTQAQEMFQTQQRALAQAQAGATGPALNALARANALLYRFGQEVDAGLQDPATFRWRHGEGGPPETPPPPDQPGPGQPGGNPDPGCDGDCVPAGDQNQPGPQPEQPGPGQPGGNPDCDGDCDPAGDQHQNQFGPQPDQPGGHHQDQFGPPPDQPGPGQPGGNPDPGCDGDCDPAGDQNQHGPQPDQPGPGQPGGNPDCDGDCDPAGDEHHHGTPPSTGTTPSPDPDSGDGPAGGEDAAPGHGDDGGGHDGGHDGGHGGGHGGGGMK